jgi:hypothetical protein
VYVMKYRMLGSLGEKKKLSGNAAKGKICKKKKVEKEKQTRVEVKDEIDAKGGVCA